MDVLELLDRIKNTPDCIVYSPCGLPVLNKGVKIPDDLKVFYENCGGISLFAGREYSFTIVKVGLEISFWSPKKDKKPSANFVLPWT